jgi:hypothetical protein
MPSGDYYNTTLKSNNLEVTEVKYFQLKSNLHERSKELACIYNIVRIVDNPAINLNDIYQRVINLLPAGWQYTDIAQAKIVIGGEEFKTKGYRDTRWNA